MAIRVRDIVIPGVKLLNDPSAVVVSVKMARNAMEVEEAEEGAEGEEGEEGAEGEEGSEGGDAEKEGGDKE
jgi:hypothetical protein